MTTERINEFLEITYQLAKDVEDFSVRQFVIFSLDSFKNTYFSYSEQMAFELLIASMMKMPVFKIKEEMFKLIKEYSKNERNK